MARKIIEHSVFNSREIKHMLDAPCLVRQEKNTKKLYVQVIEIQECWFFFPKAACGSPQQKWPANPTGGTNILQALLHILS